MAKVVIIAISHSLICRWDGMYRSWEKVERVCRIQVIQIGNGLRHASKSDSKPCEVEVNSYTPFPTLGFSSSFFLRKTRVLVEIINFGARAAAGQGNPLRQQPLFVDGFSIYSAS